MTPAAIIQQAQADGVILALSPTGSIKAVGTGDAVNRWLPIFREYSDERDDGEKRTLLSLIDAFRALDPDPDAKGLSYAVDTATLATTTITVDIGGVTGWANTSQLASPSVHTRPIPSAATRT